MFWALDQSDVACTGDSWNRRVQCDKGCFPVVGGGGGAHWSDTPVIAFSKAPLFPSFTMYLSPKIQARGEQILGIFISACVKKSVGL